MFHEEKKNPFVMTWVKTGLDLGALQVNRDILDDDRYRHLVQRACILDVIARFVYIVVSRQWIMVVFLLQETGIRFGIRRGSRLDESLIVLSSLVSAFVTSLYVFPPLAVILFGETAPLFATCTLLAGLQWTFPRWTFVVVVLVCQSVLGALSVYFGGDRFNLIRLASPIGLLFVTNLTG